MKVIQNLNGLMLFGQKRNKTASEGLCELPLFGGLSPRACSGKTAS